MFDPRWIWFVLFVVAFVGFLLLLDGWEPPNQPSKKQKQHKTKNWAKRNMRQNLKRKL